MFEQSVSDLHQQILPLSSGRHIDVRSALRIATDLCLTC